MATFLLVLKNLPEILAIWAAVKRAVQAEEDAEKKAKLQNDYTQAFNASRTAGNTDALRDFVNGMRSS